MVIVNYGLHWLLVVLTAVVTVWVVALDVDDAGALAQLAVQILVNLLFVEAGSAILIVHLGEASTLGTRFGDRAVPVLILLVD